MLKVKIEHDDVLIDCINNNNIEKIFEWYNDSEEYKYATGMDKPITLEALYQKIAEVAICNNEFFVGIRLKSGQLIGVIKGGINTKYKDALWIYSIIIDKKFQNLGYGTVAVKQINNYFVQNYDIKSSYISVLEDNDKAKYFWSKLGYIEHRKMNNHLFLGNKQQDVLIMCRDLNSIKK